jgi:Uma2 family endonuclease
MTAVPEWMRPPRDEGWFADDLDHLPEAPRHTELIDGALVFMMSPQRVWHARIIDGLLNSLARQAPEGIEVERESTIRLDKVNRPEPDLLATTAPFDGQRTFFTPEQVVWVAEVVSPESAHRDRKVKLRLYAEAGIAHYWRVEEEDAGPAVHVYELADPTRPYVLKETYRHELRVAEPFAIELDLDNLMRGRRA